MPTAVEPVVYWTRGAQTLIGPKDAWERGDRVGLPERERGFPHSDTVPALDGIVSIVDTDGLAWVVKYEEEQT